MTDKHHQRNKARTSIVQEYTGGREESRAIGDTRAMLLAQDKRRIRWLYVACQTKLRRYNLQLLPLSLIHI